MASVRNDNPLGPVKAGQEGIDFLVNQTARAFGARLSKQIEHYGLDTGCYTVLRHLVREIEATPDGVAVSDLSRKLNLSHKVLAESARRLERDGWIAIGSAGERGTVLRPTRRAFSVVPVLIDASRWMLEGALNGFSAEEIEQLSDYLRRVIRNLDAPLGEDEGPLGG